jgi:TRAP-type C4-dicarboxylate transport system permease small subunit
VANVTTAGVAAPVLSTVEDVVSFSLVFIALLIPVLVLVVLAALVWAGWRLWRRIRKGRRAAPPTQNPRW